MCSFYWRIRRPLEGPSSYEAQRAVNSPDVPLPSQSSVLMFLMSSSSQNDVCYTARGRVLPSPDGLLPGPGIPWTDHFILCAGAKQTMNIAPQWSQGCPTRIPSEPERSPRDPKMSHRVPKRIPRDPKEPQNDAKQPPRPPQ